MAEGWISLHRKITEWEWYTDVNTCHLFIHCILKANHEAQTWRGIVIERGSFVTSYPKLALETGLTIKQIRNAIFKLKRAGKMAHSSTAKYSIISIKNYNKYQLNDEQQGRVRAGSGQAEGRQRATNNNDNNDNNDNNFNNTLFISNEKKQKNTDPFLNNLNSYFKSEYKKIFNITPNLSLTEAVKLAELGADVNNFESTIPDVLNKLKNIKFNFKNGSTWNANHHWLLRDDNYLNVLDGTYDDKNTTEYEQALARCKARAKEQEQK